MPAGVALVPLLLQAVPRADFLHVSDVHVDARPSGTPVPDRVRGEETFEWIARELAALDETERPEFVLATGDLTEFGAPGETWRDLERLFARLPIPWHPLPGNHDQTWNPIDAPYFARLDALETRLLAQRSYLVKRDGWALLALNSATLFEPRPSFEPDDLREVQGLLGVHAWARPLVVALHHPPDSAEFAQPHAFDAATGERRWSSPGPKSSEGGAARYDAPADCAPVVLRDRAYVCDRGHQLGWYAPDGALTRLAHANVAAIGASADGEHLFLRGTDGVLQRRP